MKVATELEFLRFFYDEADFGPADEDVRESIREDFETKIDKKVPREYRGD